MEVSETSHAPQPEEQKVPKARRMGSARRWLGRFNLLLAVLLGFGGWALLTALSTRPTFKALIDLTPQAQFSVSAETEQLLADLREREVTVRVDTFFGRIPAANTPNSRHAAAILRRTQQLTHDLLVRYQELGGDSFEVVDYDIYRDFEPVRQRKDELGGLREVQGNAQNILVVSVGKRRRVLNLPLDVATIDIPAMRQVQGPGGGNSAPPPTLESYDGESALSSAIRSLLVEGSPRIYFVEGYNGPSLQNDTGESYSELLGALAGEGFDIGLLQLEAEGRVPDDAAAVALIEPRRALSERAVDALVAYLRRGGRVFLNTVWSNIDTWTPNFDRLGDRLGFRLSDDLVCHLVRDASLPANSPGRGGRDASRLTLTGLASQHPITRPLAMAQRYPVVHNAREIRSAGDAMPEGVAFEPLLTTDRYGWLAPRDSRAPLGVDLRDPADGRAYAARTVGAVLDVEALDAPQDGPRQGHLVLLSGLAFLNAGGFQANADLGLNIFNWMVERSELVTIRGNRYVSKRIEPDPVELEHSETFLKRWVPGILLGLALLLLCWRRWL